MRRRSGALHGGGPGAEWKRRGAAQGVVQAAAGLTVPRRVRSSLNWRPANARHWLGSGLRRREVISEREDDEGRSLCGDLGDQDRSE